MKKIFIMMAMLAMALTAVCAVTADNETDVPAENEEIMLTEEGSSEDDYFGKWAIDGFNFITENVTSGWNTMTEGIVNGWNTMVQSILDGSDAVGDYIAEQHIDQKVADAWNTLKDGASNKGETAKEKLDAAYRTVRNWFVQSEETVDQEMAAAVDAVAAAAGVTEAQVSNAYRTVEIIMAENSGKVTESVTDAWQTICQSAVDKGTDAQEKASDAYKTIYEWLENFDGSENENVKQAVELIEKNSNDKPDEKTVEILNDYGNTQELLEKFPVMNPTHVEPGIGEKIQNRLLTGFENWNRGFDAWKAWGNILYTPDSIYNVHGARLTLAEYQSAMNVSLQQVNILMGAFHNMIICDDWCAIRYDITTVADGYEIPGSVMEFVQFKDYGDPLGTRVVEGWGAPKDEGYAGMAMFRGETSTAIQQKQDEDILNYEIPETIDLKEKYPVLNPTTDYSSMAEEIREAILNDFEHWNSGYEDWAAWADTFYTSDFISTDNTRKEKNLAEHKAAMQEQIENNQVKRLYFDNMLISGDWAAIHYRTVSLNLENNEPEPGERMQFLKFLKDGDTVKVTNCWTM